MYLDEHMRDLTCQRLQVDEIWSFCYAKEKNVPEHMRRKPTWKRGYPDGPKNLVGSVYERDPMRIGERVFEQRVGAARVRPFGDTTWIWR